MMLDLNDKDLDHFKNWVIAKLNDISDAQSDILADYVIALLKSDEPEDQLRANCLEQLEDFLQDKTGPFVDEVIRVIKTKEYIPGHKPEPPVIQLNASAAAFNPPTGPASAPLPNTNGAGTHSRKRGFEQSDANDGPTGRVPTGPSAERNVKQPRRGRGGFGNNPRQQQAQFAPIPGLNQNINPQGSFPQMPTPPPGFPQDPVATLMAMQQIFTQMGLPQFGQGTQKTGKRCRDYDSKGFCARGANCPYDHGSEYVVHGRSEEYDPTNANMDLDSPKKINGSLGAGRGRGDRGRGRARGDRGRARGGRSNWSAAGARHDKSNTTIVVEQIPDEKFNEIAVREAFAEFGQLDTVDLKDEFGRKLALLKFGNWDSASRAYNSPKAFFDNRFVKVYWLKTDEDQHFNNGVDAREDAMEVEESQIDPEEFAKRQEEAQKRHEENLKNQAEAQSKREALKKQIQAQAEERKKLLEKLKAKATGTAASSSVSTAEAPGAQKPADNAANGDTKPTTQTEVLRAKLAELEAEAESMGIDTEEPYVGLNQRGGGRGAYRARGYQPRGAFSYRGVPRGRGAFGAQRGGVMRLDNRPRGVAVIKEGQDWDNAKDEALKLYLLTNNLDFEIVEPHPDRKDSHIVRFKERYVGEQFLSQGTEIPGLGKVELSWIPNPPVVPTVTAAGFTGGQADTNMTDPVQLASNGVTGNGDLDAVGGEDHWKV